jgi:hypothetical protein
VQQRLLRLEVQAEVCRRGDFPDMQFLQGGTSAERARDVAAEIARTTARLRELLAAGPV